MSSLKAWIRALFTGHQGRCQAVAAALRERVWPLIASGRIRPVLHSVLPAADAAQAHALMESNQHVGKIVLAW